MTGFSRKHGGITGRSEPRTTEEMTFPHDAETTYLGWNFTSIWHITAHRNDGYPHFPLTLLGVIPGEALLEALLHRQTGLQGTIPAVSHWTMSPLSLMNIWAKREGVYELVDCAAKHNGVYVPVRSVYVKQDGEYRE